MSHATLFTVIANGPDPLRGLSAIADMAVAQDAHLDLMVVGLDVTVQGFAYAELSPSALQSSFHDAQNEAAALQKSVTDHLQGHAARVSVFSVVCPSGMLPTIIRRQARFSDLAVLPRPYGTGAGSDDATLVEAALFEAHVPVIVLPEDTTSWTVPKRIAIGWNESSEALNAVRSALPMLVAADANFITIVDPPQHGPDRSDPGGLLAQYISRHGARCEIDVLARSLPRISDVLVRSITDRDIDMMVMGAYGRARWSEAMFGGATRDMLESCPVPLFLAR